MGNVTFVVQTADLARRLSRALGMLQSSKQGHITMPGIFSSGKTSMFNQQNFLVRKAGFNVGQKYGLIHVLVSSWINDEGG